MAPYYAAMMEGLSRAYVRAVTERAGCSYHDNTGRDVGTDAQIQYIEWIDRKPRNTGVHLCLQIKATSQEDEHTRTDVTLDIKVDQYHKLIVPSPGCGSS